MLILFVSLVFLLVTLEKILKFSICLDYDDHKISVNLTTSHYLKICLTGTFEINAELVIYGIYHSQINKNQLYLLSAVWGNKPIQHQVI